MRELVSLSAVASCVLSVIAVVNCFSTGAPTAACDHIYPEGHNGDSLDLTTNPFQLSLSDFNESYGGDIYYVPGKQYNLTLSGSGGELFRGFLVQARSMADGSPVGVFTDNGDDQTLSSCSPPESALTHSSNALKSSVELSWTAPSEGVEEIKFLFAVVVQNSQNLSQFYAAVETDIIYACGLPLFVNDGGYCVETCPNGQIGNGTTGTCQELVSGYVLALNATIYYAEIHTDHPLNTPVFRIRAIIESDVVPVDLSLSLSQTGQINSLFEFEGGTSNDRLSIPSEDFVDNGNERVYDTAINLVADPGTEFDNEDYPLSLDLDITFVGLFTTPNNALNVISHGTGQILQASDPCDTDPCENGATCEGISSEEYNCSCLPGYSGINCDQVIDPCIAYQPCENQGTCDTISPSEFSCNCSAGYRGQTCSDIGDACLVLQQCTNGNCTSGIDSSYSCECFIGYTGVNCSINIDDCVSNECVNGTCIDGLASYTCECDPGFTGALCSEDINECETVDCNNGTCIDLVNDYVCNCYQDYTGQHCNEIIDDCVIATCSPLNSFFCEDGNGTYHCECVVGFTGQDCTEEVFGCDSDPCVNGGTCINQPAGAFICLCSPEWTGMTCSEDATPCEPNPCANGGSCSENDSSYACDCAIGWTGSDCIEDIDECFSNLCDNGGTCINVDGYYRCECADGFNGTLCKEDLDFCETLLDRCLNGVCEEGYGSDTSCNCTLGYGGDTCADDDPNVLFCKQTFCENGGTCNEGFGPNTNCTCARGFMGDSCGDDDPSVNFCDNNSCSDGGVCEEAFGDSVVCMCFPGYTGPACIIMTCLSDTCFNGGTCVDSIEGNGSGNITCICPSGFTGTLCDIDIDTFCETTTCLNGGTCIEGQGDHTWCECVTGFTGESCSDDDPIVIFCNDASCINGGICNESYGPDTTCLCIRGYTGENCADDDTNEIFCEESENVCLNGGICNELYGPDTNCTCVRGYTGRNCSEDDENEVFCEEGSCSNNGTCNEEYGPNISCICVRGYGGEACTDDDPLELFCEEAIDLCHNGGTCNELHGPSTDCTCLRGFKGTFCEEDDPEETFCEDNTCQHGGTCEEMFGDTINCTCASGYTGNNCQVDLNFCTDSSCMNGGTCMEESGQEITCSCIDGFDGDLCEIDIDTFCITRPIECNNGGSCVEGYGNATNCECVRGYSGESCSDDDPSETFCNGSVCENGGSCNEGFGSSTNCSCISGFTGDSCMEDDTSLLFCSSELCLNGGTCNEEHGPSTNCSCVLGYNGDECSQDDPNISFCVETFCQNGGTCNEEHGPFTSCNCIRGFTGSSCEDDNPTESFCGEVECTNGGTCNEEFGQATSCNCVRGFTGTDCSLDDPSIIICEEENLCMNGGTCNEEYGPETSCMCPTGYTGAICEIMDDGVCTGSDCGSGRFCNITCASDNYPTHYALLSTRVIFTGESFIRVHDNLHPDFSTDLLSIFAYFKQIPNTLGYLFFYGTSESSRNLAVFLDGIGDIIWLFYTDESGKTRNKKIDADIFDGNFHSLAISININAKIAQFFVDGISLGNPIQLSNPDLNYGIDEDNSALLYVGARPPRHYRFSGEIENIVVFPNEFFSEEEAEMFHNDIDGLITPTGTCVNYLQENEECPAPTQPPSLLCTSVYGQCAPSLRCLPQMDGTYKCQPKPLECVTDESCSSGYFCGSPLPKYGSNYYDHVGEVVSGDTTFLQQNTLQLNGRTVIPIENTLHPQLSSDLTIFATVCQEAGNDGYIVGKGVNDRVRDFGLYLRSSKQTVWLAYGYSDNEEDETSRFREILYFTNVLVADGSCHSVASVIDHSLNRAVLYIDGNAFDSRNLPSTPEFLPEFNTLYVGGRPSTGLFRFKGTISNLFVSTAPLSGDIIAALHNQAFEGSDISLISLTNTVQYCYSYQDIGRSADCYVETANFNDNNFRCHPSERCIPVFDQSNAVILPVGSDDPLVIKGECVSPCDASCTSEPQDLQCGQNGVTYYNSCYRICANKQRLDDSVDECPNYYNLFTS